MTDQGYRAGYMQALADMRREIKSQLRRAHGSDHEMALKWLRTLINDKASEKRGTP